MVKRSIWNVMSSVFGTHQDTDIERRVILYLKQMRKEIVSFPNLKTPFRRNKNGKSRRS